MSYKGSIFEMWGFVIVQDVTKKWSTIQTIEWKWGWSTRTWMVAIRECLYADLWRRFALSSGTWEKKSWVLLGSGKKPCHLFLRFPIQWLKGANSNAWGINPIFSVFYQQQHNLWGELQIDSYIWQTLQEGCLNMHSNIIVWQGKYTTRSRMSSDSCKSLIQTRRTRFPMEAKVDSMQPQESCGHKINQVKRRLSRRNIATHLKRWSQPSRHDHSLRLISSILYLLLDLIPDWLLFTPRGNGTLLSLSPTFQLLSAICTDNLCVKFYWRLFT